MRFHPSNRVKGVGSVPWESKQDSRLQLDRLMEQYGSRLLRMCALYLRDASLAQDAVQDTFLKAYRRMDEFRAEAAESTWLTSIAINVCRDYQRTAWFRHMDRRKSVEELPEEPDSFAFPDNTVLTEVMRLSKREREVVLLRYYQGMKLKEVSQALGISDSAVRKRLNRANALLRKSLKGWYSDEDA